MCIAIVKTKNGKISDEYLRNCFNNNSDGAGLAYSHDGELFYIKGIFDVKQFIDEVRKAEELADGAMLIHCRISTSGLVDKDNCHPHVVNEKTVMIHNGILDIDVPKNSTKSDTVIFVENLLSGLPVDFMNDKGIMDLITFTIGKSNKFCFLNNKGEYAIANEEAGEWVDGVWYSNSTYSYSYKSYYGYNYGWGKSSKKSSKGGKNYYGSYAFDYDDYDYDEYSQVDKDEDELVLTDKEILRIKDIILDLTDDELMQLGECPVYDFWTGELKSEGKYDGDGDEFLYELDEDLQYLYDLKFQGYDEDMDLPKYADEVFGELEEEVYGERTYVDIDEVADATDDNLDEYEVYDKGWQFVDDDVDTDTDITDDFASDDFNDRYKPKKNNVVIMK